MRLPALPHAAPLDAEAFRNIYTIIDREDLLDDVLESEGDRARAASWRDRTAQIDNDQPYKNRSFQYGDTQSTTAVFREMKWRGSRFSDGSYGVWYGALEEETSLRETLYWFFKRELENLPYASGPIRSERAMYRSRLTDDLFVDLRPMQKKHAELKSNDYTFCQALGAKARTASLGGLLAPSARRLSGTNTVVFRPDVIREETKAGYYRFLLGKDQTLSFQKVQLGAPTKVDVPSSWTSK